MSVKVAEGVVEVTADAKGVSRKIADDIDRDQGPIEQSGRGMGGRLAGGIVAGFAAVGGIAAVTSFFTGAVTGASDLNETVNKSSTIFGEYFGSIDKWTDRSAQTLGMSKAAALDAAAGFGNMFTQLGFVGQQAADMSRAVVQTSADLGSFNNLPTADVADRMSAAFRGEYDSLQALIPNINAARVEQEAMAATGKTNAAELTAQEKAAAVLAIVQKDGAAAMGDFAKTADDAANSGKIATAMMEDQQAKLGQQLLPAWSGLLGFLTEAAIPAFGEVVEWVGKNSDTLLLLGGVVAGAAVSYGLITTAMGIYKAFQIASAAATGGLTVAQWALNAAMSANPIGLVITLIAALVAGIVWVATQTTFFQDTWAIMTEAIGAAWSWLWGNVLEPVFTAIGAVFTWLYDNVITPVVTGIMIYVGLWAALFTWLYGSVVQPVFTAIGAMFSWLYANVVQPVSNLIGAALRAAGAVFSWLYGNAIKPALDGVGSAFQWVYSNVIKPVSDFISSAIRSVGTTVSSVFGGIASFIGSAFQSVAAVVRAPLNAVIGMVNGAIGALNGIRVNIPSWVPIVGGQTFGLNLPRIPMLARGSNNAPDAFIAGEQGPELITGARGATVRPYSATQDVLQRMATSGGQGGGVTIQGDVILDAKNVREFEDVVAMIRALPQVARAGRVSVGG